MIFSPTLEAHIDIEFLTQKDIQRAIRTLSDNVENPVLGLAVSFDKRCRVAGLALSTGDKAIFLRCQDIRPGTPLSSEALPPIVSFNLERLALCLWHDLRVSVDHGIHLNSALVVPGRPESLPGDIARYYLDRYISLPRIDSLWEQVNAIDTQRKNVCLQAWLAYR